MVRSAETMESATVGIVGAGRLGLSLASILREKVVWCVNRGAEGRARMQHIVGHNHVYASLHSGMALPTYIVLAVADSAIAERARACADVWQQQLRETTVLHCSGAQTRDILVACEKAGARTAVAHPYQTIAAPSPTVFQGIAWGIEATEEARLIVVQFVQLLGGTPFFLPNHVLEHKGVYHASAVIASNYLTMLTGIAADAAALAGIPAAEFLPAIMRTALENSLAALQRDGAAVAPLTGPIARADIATIEAHVQQLRSHRHVLRAYCLLGIATAELAARYGIVDGSAEQQILNIFKRELGDTNDIA